MKVSAVLDDGCEVEEELCRSAARQSLQVSVRQCTENIKTLFTARIVFLENELIRLEEKCSLTITFNIFLKSSHFLSGLIICLSLDNQAKFHWWLCAPHGFSGAACPSSWSRLVVYRWLVPAHNTLTVPVHTHCHH